MDKIYQDVESIPARLSVSSYFFERRDVNPS